MHPLDQFRAFQSLRDGGMNEEEIAARHFVTPAVVKQRLRLASISPKLHDVYAEDGLTLEQLMAFSVTADQARQEQVWDHVSRSQLDEAYQIRRMLTENPVRASDRRVQFIGLDAYEQAGGAIMRDLFEHDDGGWLQDVPLLDRLVTEKLKVEAEIVGSGEVGMRFWAVATLAVLLAGCALQRSQVAQEARASMVGMTKEQVFTCMGPAPTKASEGATEIWSYPSGNGYQSSMVVANTDGNFNATRSGNTVSGNVNTFGTASGISTRRFCNHEGRYGSTWILTLL